MTIKLVDPEIIVSQCGLPFCDITDDQITNIINANQFVDVEAIYNVNDTNAYMDVFEYDIRKIATIAKEIKMERYNMNRYVVIIWDDGNDDVPSYDTDGFGLYHIRAFHYCKKKILMDVLRE